MVLERLGRTIGELAAGVDDERAARRIRERVGQIKDVRGSGASLRVDVQVNNPDGTNRLIADCRMPGVNAAPALNTVVRVSQTSDAVNFAHLVASASETYTPPPPITPGTTGDPKAALIATCALTTATALTPTSGGRMGTWTAASLGSGRGHLNVRTNRIQYENYVVDAQCIGFTVEAEVGGTAVDRAFAPLGPGALTNEVDENGETQDISYAALRLSASSNIRIGFALHSSGQKRMLAFPFPSGFDISGETANAWDTIPANTSVKVYEARI